MGKGTREADRHVEAVLKAMDILECFFNKPSLSLKEIVAFTGLNRSRAIRLIGTLVARGYLQYSSEERQYSLSSRVFALGRVYECNNIMIALSQPILKRLSKETGEASTLWALEGIERVILGRSQEEAAPPFPLSVGTRHNLHAGSAGKVILAHLSPEAREAVLQERPLVAYTDNTLIDRENLDHELKKIRQQGFGISIGEISAGVWAVAAPVFDYKTQICGAITLAGPIARFDPSKKDLCKRLVIEAAAELSDGLGHPYLE